MTQPADIRPIIIRENYMPQLSCSILDRQWFALAVFALCALMWGSSGNAQVLPNELKSAVVRVTVTDSARKGQSSTGFLWKMSNGEVRVVSALHGVLHKRLPDRTIRVYCGGSPTKASVSKVYKDADLVLLKPDVPIQGCKMFTDKLQNTDAASLKPPPRTELFTFGWKGAASASTSRYLLKGEVGDGSETLAGLVDNKTTKDALVTLQFPSLQLDMYFVQGPLGGGYSGGPVVDESGRLLGIVDGGLDQGASDYNWLIPASYLAKLETSGDSTIPVVDLKLLDAHFSAGLVEPAGTQTEIAFAPRPQIQNGSRYHFVKTKTRSLAELANTSNDPDGIRKLVRAWESVVGSDVEHRLQFDIFEDMERSLIIAAPVGQVLADGPLPDHPDVYGLRTESDLPGEEIQFEELVPDEEGYQEVATGPDDRNFFPRDPGYFDAYIYDSVKKCQGADAVCTLDVASRHIAQLPNGNKILNFGVYVGKTPPTVPHYFYYSVAVRDNVAFRARAQIQVFPSAKGLFQCTDPSTPCDDTSVALKQLSQMVAAQLTTFGINERPQPPMDLQVF